MNGWSQYFTTYLHLAYSKQLASSFSQQRRTISSALCRHYLGATVQRARPEGEKFISSESGKFTWRLKNNKKWGGGFYLHSMTGKSTFSTPMVFIFIPNKKRELYIV
jgi:hypothetical protein